MPRAQDAEERPNNPSHFLHCTWTCRCREAQEVRERPSMEVRCGAMFDHCKWLNMKESENRAFRFPCPEKSRMD